MGKQPGRARRQAGLCFGYDLPDRYRQLRMVGFLSSGRQSAPPNPAAVVTLADRRKRSLYGRRKLCDQFADLIITDDEWRRQHHMIS